MDISTLARFHIAPGYDPAAPDTWVWEDRSADVRHAGSPAVRITGGRGDEVGQVEAGSGNLEVANAGGHYCIDNPLGRWYGLLAIGCPARWGTISGAEAFTANTTNGWGTPDVGISWSHEGPATWSSTGGVGAWTTSATNVANSSELVGADARDGEATWVASVPAAATGAPLWAGLLARRRTGGVDTLIFIVEFGTGGALNVIIRRDHGGVLTNLATGSAGTYSAGQRIKAKAQWDGQNLRMRAWPEAGSEPTTTWMVTATDDQCPGAVVGMHAARRSGNTNTNPVVINFDNLEIEAVEITGTIPEFPVRWDPTAQESWAPLEIAGVTRELSQGDEELLSPIYRQLSAQPACGYWPLEDGEDSTSAASALPGGRAAGVTDVSFGSTDCPPGASSAAVLNTSGSSRIGGRIPVWSVPRDGYAAMCYARLPSVPASSSPIDNQRLMDISTAGTVVRWVVYMTSTGFFIKGYLSDGSLQVDLGSYPYTIDPTKWCAVQLETQESGGTVTWALIWHQVGATTFYAPSGTYSGTADRIYSGSLLAPVDGTIVSNLWLGDDLLPFVTSTFQLVSAGYASETATNRLKRLYLEAGLQIAVEAGTSEALGPQKPGRFMDAVRSAEAADMGVLYEAGAGHGYRPRSARYNRPVDMALTIGANGDISDDPLPQPSKSDQYTRNRWTVSRDSGSSATAQDDAHIALSRRRSDATTINVYTDDVLPDHASWRVHLGTWGEYRWPQITLDLTDRPTLLAAWRGRPFGPRITISGVPAQGPIGQDLDLIVEGWSQDISSASWKVTLNCSPARPWDVGVYDESRYDSASTTLSAGVSSSATSLAFSIVNARDTWNTTATPYDVTIAGERVTVTTMGTKSGTGPYAQTATVTRSVNGIVKALPAGAEVHLATPGRYAL